MRSLAIVAAFVAGLAAGAWVFISRPRPPEWSPAYDLRPAPESDAHAPPDVFVGWGDQPIEEPDPASKQGAMVRPISTAESVLAIWSDPDHEGLVMAAWPDGRIVWSGDRLNGGPPYRTGRVEPNRVAALLAEFDRDGLFADKKLRGVVCVHCPAAMILIRSGKRKVELFSGHELGEVGGRFVEDGHGLRGLQGRRRLEILRESQADWLFYRFVWSETKGRLTDLIPLEGTPTAGTPVRRPGGLYWREPPTETKPAGAANPQRP